MDTVLETSSNIFISRSQGPKEKSVIEDTRIRKIFQLDNAEDAFNRLPQIYNRVKEICFNSIIRKIEAVGEGIQAIEEFSTAIIERASHLQDEEKQKPVKKFAFLELMKTLESLGLSFRPAVISQVI